MVECFNSKMRQNKYANVKRSLVNTTYILLGSYYMYWYHKCSDWYFLDQPVRIFVNGGKFSNQYSLFQKKTGTNSSTDSLLSFVPVFFETDVTYNRKSGIVVKKTSTMDFYWDRSVLIINSIRKKSTSTYNRNLRVGRSENPRAASSNVVEIIPPWLR